MNAYWTIMLPLVRPLLVKVGIFFAAVALCLAVLWWLEQWQLPQWKSAQKDMQGVQSSLTQANMDFADIEKLGDEFARYSQSGLVGGAPRAGWIEDLQRIAGSMGLESVLSYNLASPVPVMVATTSQARVTRHELSVSIASVHELESLQLVQQFVDLYPDTAQLASCEFAAPTESGLMLSCKINLLHIEPSVVGSEGTKK